MFVVFHFVDVACCSRCAHLSRETPMHSTRSSLEAFLTLLSPRRTSSVTSSATPSPTGFCLPKYLSHHRLPLQPMSGCHHFSQPLYRSDPAPCNPSSTLIIIIMTTVNRTSALCLECAQYPYPHLMRPLMWEGSIFVINEETDFRLNIKRHNGLNKKSPSISRK